MRACESSALDEKSSPGMPLSITIDKEKLLQAIAYIASRCPKKDTIHIVKVLYFAEKNHLEKYGRLIAGSTYARMDYGPVPSEAYDILKAIIGKTDNYFVSTNPALIEKARSVLRADTSTANPTYHATHEPEVDLLSRSDIKCLDAAIEDVGSLSFGELKIRSHDLVWEAAGQAKVHFIPIEILVSAMPDRDKVMEFLTDRG